MMDARPTVGLVGVRQLTGRGVAPPDDPPLPERAHRARRRVLGGAAAAPAGVARRARLDPAAYEREVDCDWTSGSFMLVRREAIESAGMLDERFFMYSDETDFCRRIKTAGWEVRHLPQMTIRHYDDKAGVKPGIESLAAHSRMKYARKHFSPAHRVAYAGAILLRHALRSVYSGGGESGRRKRAASRRVVGTLLGSAPAPHADKTSALAVTPADPELRDRRLMAREGA